jgi:hypothetical protein
VENNLNGTIVDTGNLMSITIKPLKRKKRTTQRGKRMTQKQRWGEVIITHKEKKND